MHGIAKARFLLSSSHKRNIQEAREPELEPEPKPEPGLKTGTGVNRNLRKPDVREPA